MQAHISKFHWSRDTRTLSTEASDLGLRAADDIPAEIAVQGIRETITFVNPTPLHNDEHETVLWTYTSAATPIRLVVFND